MTEPRTGRHQRAILEALVRDNRTGGWYAGIGWELPASAAIPKREWNTPAGTARLLDTLVTKGMVERLGDHPPGYRGLYGQHGHYRITALGRATHERFNLTPTPIPEVNETETLEAIEKIVYDQALKPRDKVARRLRDAARDALEPWRKRQAYDRERKMVSRLVVEHDSEARRKRRTVRIKNAPDINRAHLDQLVENRHGELAAMTDETLEFYFGGNMMYVRWFTNDAQRAGFTVIPWKASELRTSYGF